MAIRNIRKAVERLTAVIHTGYANVSLYPSDNTVEWGALKRKAIQNQSIKLIMITEAFRTIVTKTQFTTLDLPKTS